ncbi:hypothetical protein TTHERM_00322770 (macronuclear) [Tetrahymena thermophila SB210]|uniref:Uncharacterized protein n=1 Tax=Tetrahymena thermophila (strain SB210) TaxID=312017 RepID=Q237K8_TETTS|nr:hypothetical protein TTHERM_00322770 [Tetrahymena thermophila SB210]EAR92733.1 hypothetical protein TTHERM_00322770 [Tetrahymena thermophila SB210]|eukprot:XP_001012978.1 hypothetical protein TTHERM_00322770 [Tetrahymena thermophila SB210]
MFQENQNKNFKDLLEFQNQNLKEFERDVGNQKETFEQKHQDSDSDYLNLEENQNQFIDDNTVQSVLKILNKLNQTQQSQMSCKKSTDLRINFKERFYSQLLRLHLEKIDIPSLINLSQSLGQFKNIQDLYLFINLDMNSQLEIDLLDSINKLQKLQVLNLYLKKNYCINTDQEIPLLGIFCEEFYYPLRPTYNQFFEGSLKDQNAICQKHLDY